MLALMSEANAKGRIYNIWKKFYSNFQSLYILYSMSFFKKKKGGGAKLLIHSNAHALEHYILSVYLSTFISCIY